MKEATHYINSTLGIDTDIITIDKARSGRLPMFINEAYWLYTGFLFNRELLFAEVKNHNNFNVLQLEKHCSILENNFNKIVVFVIENLDAYNRKKLIDRGINFIVPYKQLFLPKLLMDLRESYTQPREKRREEKLLPSAQFLLIYHILHRNQHDWKIEQHSFKEIAKKLGYTAMAITNAVDDLKHYGLAEVTGEREKYLHFKFERHELWREAEHQNLLVNPVLKTAYVDKLPKDIYMLHSNASALPEYTNMNPGKQQHFALEKTIFYGLLKSNALLNLNEREGEYCLEIWKYDPLVLAGEMPNDMSVVDPLSLYLSLKGSQDERIEMALEQIIDKYIW